VKGPKNQMNSPNGKHRSYSDKYVSGMSEYDLFKNKNVDWISGPFTKVCYLIFLLLAWGMLHISTFFSAEDCWTVTNILHGVVFPVNFSFINKLNINLI